MKNIYKTFLFFSVIILAKCTSLPGAPGKTELDLAKKKYPEATLAELKSGHTTYNEKCGTCHGLKKIEDYNQESWTKLIDAMAPKAKLNATETENLRKYIYAARESKN